MTNIKRIFATIMLIAFIAVALLSYQGVGNKMMAVNAETASATDDERICQDIKEDAKFSTNEILVVLDAETSRLDGIIVTIHGGWEVASTIRPAMPVIFMHRC